jgi:pre-mRNA-splicing factor 38A
MSLLRVRWPQERCRLEKMEPNLIDRIEQSRYWRERCFSLTTESWLHRAKRITYAGGQISSHGEPSPFACLLCALLNLKLAEGVLNAMLANSDFRYIRLLAAFAVRFKYSGSSPASAYRLLEPLYNDFRRVQIRSADGEFAMTHVDVVVDSLLRDVRVIGIAVPRIAKRFVVEMRESLAPRATTLPRRMLIDAGLLECDNDDDDDVDEPSDDSQDERDRRRAKKERHRERKRLRREKRARRKQQLTRDDDDDRGEEEERHRHKRQKNS